MYEEYTAAIKGAVTDISIAFLNNAVEMGPAIVKPETTPYEPPQAEIAARIEYSGKISGGVHLTCSLDVAVALAATFCGEEMTDYDETVKDAFGELANQVAGGVQTKLSSMLGGINLTPPTVVVKSKLTGDYSPESDSIKHFFKFNGGAFLVDLYFREN